jgi:DNA topoisomerase I
MAKYVVIVESPGKVRTISSYLGSEYKVLASVGHIRVLDKTGKYNLGVDVDGNFDPIYKNDPLKRDIIKKLKEETKDAEMVYLASDADLEGESIAWHLEQVLKLPKKKVTRITFNEITEKAVKEAIKNPRQIDQQKVDAQETRRILDRIIGFRLSGITISKLGAKSAGRVQSSALRILAEREREILNFKPKIFYEIYLPFVKDRKNYKAQYKGTAEKKVVSIKEKADVDQIVNECIAKKYTVSATNSKDRVVYPKPPYTTSTFQQEVSSRIGYGSKKAMQIAQSLYEGVNVEGKHYGLITYMRTDSIRLSDDFIKEAKILIEKDHGKKYYAGKITQAKKSGDENVQDAHEGIRPSHLEFTPEKISAFLTKEELKVYTLIYSRAISALMAPAKMKDTEVIIANGKHLFGITGHEIVFDGFFKVYKEYSDDDDDAKILPSFKVGESVNDKDLIIEKKQTTPPSRYTEASLVKKMEELGIGRPSTYAATMETLKAREYIDNDKKAILVTEKGLQVNDLLVKYFNEIINTTYTADMESKLDQISEGKVDKLKELKAFYDLFAPLVLTANKEANKDKPKPQETDEICPTCGAKLVIRKGRFGDFYACSRFPHCKYTGKIGEAQKSAEPKVPAIDTGVKCPTCGEGKLVERIAKTGVNAGSKFYACNRFPKCKTTINEQDFITKYKGLKTKFSKLSTDNDE